MNYRFLRPVATAAFLLAVFSTLNAEEPRRPVRPSKKPAVDRASVQDANVAAAPGRQQGLGSAVTGARSNWRSWRGHIVHSCFWNEP